MSSRTLFSTPTHFCSKLLEIDYDTLLDPILNSSLICLPETCRFQKLDFFRLPCDTIRAGPSRVFDQTKRHSSVEGGNVVEGQNANKDNVQGEHSGEGQNITESHGEGGSLHKKPFFSPWKRNGRPPKSTNVAHPVISPKRVKCIAGVRLTSKNVGRPKVVYVESEDVANYSGDENKNMTNANTYNVEDSEEENEDPPYIADDNASESDSAMKLRMWNTMKVTLQG
ncbi:hypothetical protein E2542_SST22009 [Spatholobus suberectus]|nr:hypothetical protein E2542_SST22009 [Spatholobus suberectus]